MKKAGQGKKVLVAMSGGVDSCVAAVLLLEQGYEVVGCFMRLGSDDSVERDDVCIEPGPDTGKAHRQGCCSVNDAGDARLVAAILDIPLYVMNFKRDFNRIIDYFVDEYNDGRTPNPCIRCNSWLKFGKLAAYAQSINADHIATGHYARLQRSGSGRSHLLRGSDLNKDQSYVLFDTSRDMLERMLLPVGEYEKPQIRRIAERCSLPVFDKPDSQEICFVPDNDYFGLVKRRTPDQVTPGPIVDRDGRVLGQHDGHQHFTIGQRRGLSVSLGHPIYVTEKDAQTNTVVVGAKQQVVADGLAANGTNWLIDPPTRTPMRCRVQIRSGSRSVPATVQVMGPDALEVQFEQPQAAVSPGQAVVCYDGDELVGGGWIDHAI